MSHTPTTSRKKVTINSLRRKKRNGVPISMVTAYDFSQATLAERAEIDMLLVGDSLAMVVLGYDSTVPVTVEEMLHHCKAVARGSKTAFRVGDMPFMSFQADVTSAVVNAGRFLKEGGMEAVKLEGGAEVADTVRAIVNAGIPVLGHVGLTPQSVSKLSGYRVQGKSANSAEKIYRDALTLQEAGCFGIVLEAIPAPVATIISEALDIPTIGIGAGAGCDGQVLVYHDMLGLFDRLNPRFVKSYANAGDLVVAALAAYHADVVSGQFPAQEHTYPISDDALADFKERIGVG